jgi:phage/plasmid-associated DNA primase
MLFNQLSKINDTKDGGFLRRFLAINFPNKFVKSNPKPEKNIFLADNKLKDKIKKDEDFKKQYLLILLDYCRSYIENNEMISIPDKIYKNSRKLIADQDPYEDFIEENILITKGDRDYLKLDDVWNRFKEYFGDSRPKERIPTKKTFKDNLVKTIDTYDGAFFADSKNRYKSQEGGKSLANVFVGIKFLDDE